MMSLTRASQAITVLRHSRLPQAVACRLFAVTTTEKLGHAEELLTLSNVRFDQPRSIYARTPTSELVKKGILASSMKFGIVYQNLPVFMNIAYKLLGKKLTLFFVKHTLFQHFCGGETLQDLMKCAHTLSKMGVGTIVDYAAESENSGEITSYWLDKNVELTIEGIEASAHIRDQIAPNRFAFLATKPTAVCPPHVLESINYTLNLMHSLYAYGVDQITEQQISIFHPKHHDVLMKKNLPVHKALSILQTIWPTLSSDQTQQMIQEMLRLPIQSASSPESNITYFQWVDYFTPECLEKLPKPTIFTNTKTTQDAHTFWISKSDIQEWDFALRRLYKCFDSGKQNNVRLLIDAEGTNVQSAIDWIANRAAERYARFTSDDPSNTAAIIYNTYQMYAKNTMGKLITDAYRADALGYKFGVKIVCGAYMKYESTLCAKYGTEYPIHDTFALSRENFDKAIEFMMKRMPKSEVLCASHNEASIQKAARRLGQMTGDVPDALPMTFAQLLSMADYLSYQLAHVGTQVYKYTPYGAVDLVLPYLIRRGEENSSIFGHAGKEAKFFWAEVRRRAKATIGLDT